MSAAIMTPTGMVRQFHEAMGHPVNAEFDPGHMAFRLALIFEEMREVAEAGQFLINALKDQRGEATVRRLKAAFLKEMCDLEYVMKGTSVAFGWKHEEAFRRVHSSNMSKAGPDGKPVKRSDGKVIKGPNYQPPALEDLV